MAKYQLSYKTVYEYYLSALFKISFWIAIVLRKMIKIINAFSSFFARTLHPIVYNFEQLPVSLLKREYEKVRTQTLSILQIHNGPSKGTQNVQKTIVFTADLQINTQLTTAIKSICCHNTGIRFYLINRDYPPEWFQTLNEHLLPMNCQIIDKKIGQFSRTYPSYDHINSQATYFRYFIPELIEEDVTLYLDYDIIVTGQLDDLYQTDLNTHFCAAVEDLLYCKMTGHSAFNAGVMLFNNQLCRIFDLPQKAVSFSDRWIRHLRDADQAVLNILFGDHWIKWDHSYNYQVGIEQFTQAAPYYQNERCAGANGGIPLIIHFNTWAKPWNKGTKMGFRDLYHEYAGMTWRQICALHFPPSPPPPPHTQTQACAERIRRRLVDCSANTVQITVYDAFKTRDAMWSRAIWPARYLTHGGCGELSETSLITTLPAQRYSMLCYDPI